MLRADSSTTPAAPALSLAELTMLRDRSTTLTHVEGVVIVNGNLGAPDEQEPLERVTAASATDGFLSMLGVRPLIGRLDLGLAARKTLDSLGGNRPVHQIRPMQAFTRYLSALLLEVRPTDPSTLAAVAALLLSVALLACYVPARRAGRLSVSSALRAE